MVEMFREGDTTILMLDYQLNGEDLTENTYDEMELQLNPQSSFNSVKKLLSKNEITWSTVYYEEDGETKTFTGYVVELSQQDTFKLRDGKTSAQLRIMFDGNVGSSEISIFDIGNTLSTEVLYESD